MSNRSERQAEDYYEQRNDASPVSGDAVDNSYAQETRGELKNHIPVQSDQQGYDDPMQPPYSNTDNQLGMFPALMEPRWSFRSRLKWTDDSAADDEREAVNPSNILRGDRLRHAKPQSANKYSEGPGEEDLPDDVQYGTSGTSERSTRWMCLTLEMATNILFCKCWCSYLTLYNLLLKGMYCTLAHQAQSVYSFFTLWWISWAFR